MKENTVGLDYEKEYEKLQYQIKYELEEQAQRFREELDRERNTKNLIIEQQEKDIEFYKNIIKSILHIK